MNRVYFLLLSTLLAFSVANTTLGEHNSTCDSSDSPFYINSFTRFLPDTIQIWISDTFPLWIDQKIIIGFHSIFSSIAYSTFTVKDWFVVSIVSSLVSRWNSVYRSFTLLWLVQWMASQEIKRQLSSIS